MKTIVDVVTVIAVLGVGVLAMYAMFNGVMP